MNSASPRYPAQIPADVMRLKKELEHVQFVLNGGRKPCQEPPNNPRSTGSANSGK